MNLYLVTKDFNRTPVAILAFPISRLQWKPWINRLNNLEPIKSRQGYSVPTYFSLEQWEKDHPRPY